MNNVTEKTRELTTRWINAKNNLARTERETNSARCELANASNDLGKWLVPQGQNDEPFNIWFGSGILQAVRLEHGDFKISWRKEPDGKDRELGV